MRISSFLILTKEYYNEFSVISYDCIDETGKFVEKLGGSFFKSDKNNWHECINNKKFNEELLIINLDQNMSLEKLNKILKSNINVLRKSQIMLKDNKIVKNTLKSRKKFVNTIRDIENISWMYFDKIGFNNYISNENNNYFNDDNVKVDFNNNEEKIKTNKNTELNKKRVKNPLILFCIPGLLMIISSFILVYNVIGKYDSIDSVSLGTAIVTIGATVLGILSLMSGIISYFIGKQTEFILTNYSD